jgi:hypothetical protein
MKTLIFAIFIMTFTSCNSNGGDKSLSENKNRADTVVKHDTIYLNNDNNPDWQKNFDLTRDPDKDTVWGKAVSYYLNDKDCAGITYEFYYGYFRPRDQVTMERQTSF